MMMHEPPQLIGLRGRLAQRAPLAKYTSWRAGGTAETLYLPADRDDLAAFLRQLTVFEPITVLGLGSNVLVRDGGIRGTVIVMHNPGATLAVSDGLIYADAGAASPKLARFAATHGCTEAEFLAGVPGTVGGALAMNAGCYGSEAWDVVERLLTVDRRGQMSRRDPQEYEIGYRHVALRPERRTGTHAGDEYFVAAWFRFATGDAKLARSTITELLQRRIATQPLQQPNAGSVFRNPPDDFAARLIESCALKGFAIGGAMISSKHANFIINTGTATAADIEALIEHTQHTVLRQCGVALEREVRIIGEKA